MLAPQTTIPTRLPRSRSGSGRRGRRWPRRPPARPPAWPTRRAGSWRAAGRRRSRARGRPRSGGRGRSCRARRAARPGCRRWCGPSSIDWGEPAAKLRRIESAPSGSTPKTWRRRAASSLTAAATPAQSPPPPIGHDHRVERPGLLDELEAEGRGAEGGQGPLEGMDEGPALLRLDLLDPREGQVDVVDQLDLAPMRAAARHPECVGRLRHHDLGGGAEHAAPRRPPPWRGCPRTPR